MSRAGRSPAPAAREPKGREARRLKQQSRAALANVREGFDQPIDDTPSRPGRLDTSRPPAARGAGVRGRR